MNGRNKITPADLERWRPRADGFSGCCPTCGQVDYQRKYQRNVRQLLTQWLGVIDGVDLWKDWLEGWIPVPRDSAERLGVPDAVATADWLSEQMLQMTRHPEAIRMQRRVKEYRRLGEIADLRKRWHHARRIVWNREQYIQQRREDLEEMFG
jgi:hypothetical protein